MLIYIKIDFQTKAIKCYNYHNKICSRGNLAYPEIKEMSILFIISIKINEQIQQR